MNLNLTLTDDQEKAVRYFRRKHNDQPSTETPLTAQQFGELHLTRSLNALVAAYANERNNTEIVEALRNADAATINSIRTTLNLSDA